MKSPCSQIMGAAAARGEHQATAFCQQDLAAWNVERVAVAEDLGEVAPIGWWWWVLLWVPWQSGPSVRTQQAAGGLGFVNGSV